jgi:hypothetical protein
VLGRIARTFDIVLDIQVVPFSTIAGRIVNPETFSRDLLSYATEIA